MSTVLSHLPTRAVARLGRPLPRGIGLLIGAGISIGLWIGLFELGAWLLG